jgi:hypothetical protein
MQVKLEAYHDGESWCARGIGQHVFTQGANLDELMDNIREAVSLHLEEVLEAGEDINILVLSEGTIRGVAKAT